ncbi:MAG TPA: LuxR C-terminal-related transcriptional regulator [Streptosporangiaceae bacterium]|nr:LuxR C-terminal-related transcriptional regulator [Streptosporangiaceae bacterium]
MTDSGTLPRDEPAGLGGRSPVADPSVAAPAGTLAEPAMSGQDVLLATKLHVPRPPPGFVPRGRLAEALGEGLARGRVLVCAPAGFGKTVLLAGWVRDGGRPVAWLSLDAGDSDPVRFWRYVVAALERARPGLAGRVGPPPPGSVEGLVTALINELAAQPDDGEGLLVLDDYHLVDSGPVHESVAFLLENLPPGLRVVISSRADPPLPLARWRARGQLVELRAADLRFTTGEAAALLATTTGPGATGPALSEVAAEALVARTEGWAAGLQLAGLSLRGQVDATGFVAAFGGSHRFVLDYLADEVLDGQAAPVRAFLLETSVLERLCGGLCDAVTGRAGGQGMLEDIERTGLFVVPLDEVRGWWRYHHLFADLLRARLLAEQPDRVAGLHRAAAAWCQEHDLADDAVRHALAAGDAGWAARLVERNVEALLGRSEGVTLRRWLSALPAQAVRARPRLCLAQAYAAAQGFQLEALEALLDDAERAFAATDDEPYEPSLGPAQGDSVLANIPAGIAFLRGSLARLRGDAAAASGYCQQALSQLGEDEWLMRCFVDWNLAAADWLSGRLGPAERGLTALLAERRAGAAPLAGFLPMRVCYDLGQVQRARGDLDAALATYRQALQDAGESSRAALTGPARVGLAQVRYERDELDAALDHATQGVTLCRQLAFTPALATGLAVVARIRHAQGDAAGALEAMGQAGQIELSPQVAALLDPVPAQRARLLLAQGDATAAAGWTTATGLHADDERPDYPQEPAYLVLARVLLAHHDPGAALTLLQRLLDAAAGQGRAGSVIEIQALRALALAAHGDHAGAVGALTEALTLACPQRYVRVFADEGAPMRALLAQLPVVRPGQQPAAGRIDPGYLAALVRACNQPDSVPPGGRVIGAAPGLVEPLTERELEVLRLLAAGRSNQRIAHDLFVALDTVKKHVTHVLGKLGAANRTEAVARGRELGLIP